MTQPTSNHWICDEQLMAQWQTFTGRLANPETRDIGAVLQEAAEAQLSSKATGELVDSLLDSSDVTPLLSAYVRQLIHSTTHSTITTLEDLVTNFEQFVTRHITHTEYRADTFEQLMNRIAPFTDPIEIFRRMDPSVIIDVEGHQPVFRNPENHPGLIVRALGHLTRNAYDAGATKVTIKAECLPTDPVYTIAIEDDGPGIDQEKLQGPLDGTGGSGWRILRTVILPKLGAEWKIISPHQTDTQRGTLVMLFIPVVAQTSDTPDSGPVPAIHDSTTPNAELPAVHHPVSRQIAGAATCYRWPLPARVHLRLVR